jgi:hypothetical protein
MIMKGLVREENPGWDTAGKVGGDGNWYPFSRAIVL